MMRRRLFALATTSRYQYVAVQPVLFSNRELEIFLPHGV
jgi:hypothetical protein